MTDILDRLRAATEGVPDGPWEWRETHPTNAVAEVCQVTGYSHGIATLYGNHDDVPQPTQPGEPWGDHPIRRATARFIADARSLIPEAADTIADLRAEVEALKAGQAGLLSIVEGIQGAMEHGTWRDERGQRLKDTPEWVAFYNAAKA